MRFDILTLFPAAVEPYLAASILGRARQEKLIEAHLWDIRQFAADKHKTTDDTPYGGGAGMVMKVEPIDKALQALNDQYLMTNDQKKKVVVMSAKGKQFTQAVAAEYARLDHLVLICGRYEGIDQRVIDHLADEEISIGPYVLSGGELPALVVLEAVARHIPGVLGNPNSLLEESFSEAAPREARQPGERSGEYPQYTKPETYKGWGVPPVLLSGNHAEIQAWRRQKRQA